MSEDNKMLLMLAVCLSFFFACGIFAETAHTEKLRMMTPMIPWLIR